MARHVAVCADATFWAACDWTTYDGTVIADSTGRDAYYSARYISLSAYVEAERRDLGVTEVCEILGPWAAAEGAVNLGLWGTSPDIQLIIATVGVARHGGVFPTGTAAWRIESTSATGLNINSNDVVLDGLAVKTVGATYNGIEPSGLKSRNTIKACIIVAGRDGIYYPGTAGNGGAVIENCIASGCGRAGIYISSPINYPSRIINCTVYGCAYTYGQIYLQGYVDVYNTAAMGKAAGSDFYLHGSYAGTISNSMSSDASCVGTDCLINQSVAATFTDAADGGFSLLSTSLARGEGVYDADYTPSADIIGVLRDPTAVDIGAHQYDTSYVPTTMVPIDITGMIEGSVLAIYRTSDHAEIVAPTTIGASGAYSTTYSWTGNVPITVVVRKATGGTKYLPYSAPGLITAGGFGLVVSQVEDLVLNG